MHRKTAGKRDNDGESTSPHAVGYVPDWPPKFKKPPRGTEARTVYTKYDVLGTFVSSDVQKPHGPRVPILFTPLNREVTFHDASSLDIWNQLADNADEVPPYRKITRNSCLAVSVRTGDAARRLLELKCLAALRVGSPSHDGTRGTCARSSAYRFGTANASCWNTFTASASSS
ncbi:hypothetical protein MRX96_058930 [Rhipicephalus microplus]